MRFMAFSAGSTCLLKPAQKGTGIIAGGAVRILLEVAGVQNIVAKTLGRGNPFNAVRATMEGLRQLRDPQEVREMRKGGVEHVAV
jgi:small subunit ribosomal protein S5